MEHKFSGSFTCVNELTFALSGTQAAGTSIIQYRLSLAAERSEDKIYGEEGKRPRDTKTGVKIEEGTERREGRCTMLEHETGLTFPSGFVNHHYRSNSKTQFITAARQRMSIARYP